LFFIDETGHEEFKDPHYPVFGMGGCAQLAGLCFRHIDEPWKQMRQKRFPEAAGRPLHAAELRTPTPEQMSALGDFFREGMFSRLAVMSRVTATKPESMSMIDVVAITLLNQAAKIAGQYLFDSIGFIFEVSDRTEQAVGRAFTRFGLKDEHDRPIRILWNFLPKSAQEPGLEVADFVLHAAGGQVRHRLAGKMGSRRDFASVFQGLPPKMVQFIEVDSLSVNKQPIPVLTPGGPTPAAVAPETPPSGAVGG
jgi:hypothetical protein